MANKTSENKNLFDAATLYTQRGWVIHPIYPPEATLSRSGKALKETSRGKQPILPEWQKRERATQEELQEWFLRHSFNIGMVAGKKSNVLVIDRDHDLFWSLLVKGIPLNTLESQRMEGRGHTFFEYTPDLPSQKHHLLGIEILSDGSNVILPPSRHREGQVYRFSNQLTPAPLPDELKVRLHELFAAQNTLTAALANVRPCFQKLWNKGDPQPLHGGDGREAMAAFMLELRAHGCDLTSIKILARLVYRDEYDSEKTTAEFNNWKGKAWTCQKIRERLGAIISCDGCPLKEAKTKEEKEPSSIDRIIQLTLANCELIHDQYNDGFAIVNEGANKKVIKLRSREFRFLVGKLLWDAEEKGIGSDVLTSALNTLEGKALFDGKQVHLHNRVASHDGKIYYDLSDGVGRIIEIDSNGWRLVTNSPVLFRHEQHQKAQIEPKSGGDPGKLWRYINLTSKGDRTLCLSCLVTMFFPDIDHAISVWHGEQGSGKTFSSECVKDLIDPSSLKTTALSKDEESLTLSLYHNWLTFLDNVSEVKDWQSDIISRAITGGGISRRRRYTDEEEELYNFRRCVAINGLVIPLTAADVMDRSLLFKLKRFNPHGSKEELEKRFEEDKPEILGALFDLVSGTLKIKNSQEIQAPPGIRLYDFAVIGEAAARATGEKPGRFLELFLQKKSDDNLEVVQSSLMGSVLYSLIVDGSFIGDGHEYYPFLDEEKKWTGSPSRLLEIFNLKAVELKIDRRTKDWKGSPKGLSVELEKLKTNFRAIGIEIERGEEHAGRFINIWVRASSPLYNVINRDNCDNCDNEDNGLKSLECHEKKHTQLPPHNIEETEDGEGLDEKKVEEKRRPKEPVTNNTKLESAIQTFVTNVTSEDVCGAMVVASVNRIAKNHGYQKDDVKAAIDRMVAEGKLVIYRDDYGEYVKLADSEDSPRGAKSKKEKPTRTVNIKDIEEDGSIRPEAFDEEYQARQARKAARQRSDEWEPLEQLPKGELYDKNENPIRRRDPIPGECTDCKIELVLAFKIRREGEWQDICEKCARKLVYRP